MNWSEEFWIKLYRRMSPSFMAMHWQARGMFRLVITELDPSTGRLELGRLGLKAVAVSIRAPWPEVEQYFQECLDDGCLAVDGNDLVCPNYVEAQEAVQTGAARMRKLRETRKAIRDEASHKRGTASPKRDDSYTGGDEKKRGVTRGDESDDQRREEKRREDPPIDPQKVQRSGTRPRTVKHILPADWTPNIEHIDLASREGGRDRRWVTAQSDTMRDWATGEGKRKADWDSTFRNWMRKAMAQEDAGRASIPGAASNPSTAASRRVEQTSLALKPNPNALSPADQAKAAAEARKRVSGLSGPIGGMP